MRADENHESYFVGPCICSDLICLWLPLSCILTIPCPYTYFSVPIFPMQIKCTVGNSEE